VSAKCTQCTKPADLFLCGRCIAELRESLQSLPDWLQALEEAVNGQTRLGESVRRSTEKTGPMLCNLEASELLTQTHAVLVEWVRDICETRGVEVPT
jgi:hypothetical protein